MADDRVSIQVGKGVSRRKVLKQVAAATGMGLVAGCGSNPDNQGTSPTESVSDTQSVGSPTDTVQTGPAPDFQRVDWPEPPTDFAADPPHDGRDIVFVTHNTGSAFFIPVIVGLHDAAKQVGWSATYTGPSGGVSVSEQVEVLNSVVENNPAAIGTSLMDDTSYDDVINRALDNDIPVAVWNTGSYTPQQMRDTFGQRLPFVGQNHVSAGYASGLTMAEKLSTNSPKVTIARCCSGFQYALKRAEGIRRGLSDALDNPEFTEVLEYGQQASEAVPTIESHFAANPNLDAVASVDAFAFFVSQAVQNTGNQDEITVGGADLIANTMEVIKDGTMAYSFGQDPYTQGHEPTMQMWRYLDRGVPPKDVDTAAEIVDESKVDWVQRRSNTWGNLREWHRND